MSNWIWWALQSTVTVAVLVPVSLLACRILRKRPAVQHLLWLALLVKFATPTLGTWPVGIGGWPERMSLAERSAVPRTPEIPAAPETAAGADAAALQMPPPDPRAGESRRDSRPLPAHPRAAAGASAVPINATVPGGISVTARAREWATMGSTIAMAAWLCGGIVQLMRQVRRTWQHAAVVRRSIPATPDLAAEAASIAAALGERPPRVLVSAEVASPFVWCLGPVRLLWPQSLTGPEQIVHARAILAHEMAHVRRRDHWIVWLDFILGIVWWWNPVCWFVRRELRASAEMACDALAISTCPGRRRDYAELLLEMSAGLPQTWRPSPLAVGIGPQASFEKRLVMVCSEGVSGTRSRVAVALAIGLALIALPGWSIAPPSRGFVPSEQIFPATTLAWLSVPDPDAFRQRFESSPYGQLVNDPAMKAFVDSAREQVSKNGRQRLEKLGLTLEDLEKVPGGEVAIGAIEAEPGRLATLLLVDTTGHEAEAKKLVERIKARLLERKATAVTIADAPPQLTVYALPDDPNDDRVPKGRHVAFALAPQALIVGDDAQQVGQALGVLAQGRQDNLASLSSFAGVMKPCRAALPEAAPPLRWFVDPLGFAEAFQSSRPARDKKKGPDYVAILARQGFDAIKGAGGLVAFAEGGHGIRHHTMIHAPALPGREPQAPDCYDGAARMLRFQPIDAPRPQAWAPQKASGWSTLLWDLKAAFVNAEPLVDDVVGDKGVYDDLIASLREDPDGPQIDVEKDLVDCLTGRITVVTDHVDPRDTDAERLVIAMETNDPGRVAETIAKVMNADSDMRRIEINGHTAWELVDRSMERPTRDVDIPGAVVTPAPTDPVHDVDDEAHRRRGRLRDDRDEKLLPHSSVSVALGHLFIASHRDILERVLVPAVGDGSLGTAADLSAARAELDTLLPGGKASLTFLREDASLRPAYELLRQGSMPKSKSVFGQLLNGLLGDGKPGSVREQRIDGSALPEFEVIRRYLGTAALGLEARPDGWYIAGMSLPRPAGNAGVTPKPDGGSDR